MINNGSRYVAGVDGCRDGWVVVLLELDEGGGIVAEDWQVLPDFHGLLELAEGPQFMGVDIPIGLPSAAVPGGRVCDQEARQRLGHKRGTSVFSAPARRVLRARSYEEAVELNRQSSRHGVGITLQVYNLLPKLREVHEIITPEMQARIREVHPELSFAAMNEGPLPESKHSPQGKALRLELLEVSFDRVEDALAEVTSPSVSPEDVIDAYAAAWSAWRMARGKARHIPEQMQVDACGLRMGIWI